MRLACDESCSAVEKDLHLTRLPTEGRIHAIMPDPDFAVLVGVFCSSG